MRPEHQVDDRHGQTESVASVAKRALDQCGWPRCCGPLPRGGYPSSVQADRVVVDDVKPLPRVEEQLERLFDDQTLQRVLAAEPPRGLRHRAEQLYWTRRGHPWPVWVPGWVWVSERLAVGCAESASTPDVLAGSGLTAVLSCRARSEADDWRRARAFAEHGLLARQIGWPDCAPPSRRALRMAAGWVVQQLDSGHRVFVHCRWGVGRSGVVAMAALVNLGATAEEAYWRVCQARPHVFPNLTQTRALIRYAASLGR
ncbi:MAG: dual specificity protein phosphatase family protein [Chloroflexi bacterium]|nr:dual specificity protein phosphatase family protein [Chloroflexota bacterium]